MASESSIEIARVAVEAAQNKLGRDIVVLDVGERLGITDVFVIISAANERQAGAIVEEVEKAENLAGHSLFSREGDREDPWVLLDYFDAIIHVQHVEARTLYGLDRLWKDCPVIRVGVEESHDARLSEAAPS